jgi:2-(1,2-epoxy-1,2-dihydrophenyl)acetyl-CoA isomerase
VVVEQPTRYEVVDGVAHVVISRPAKRNALSRAVLDRLAAHAAAAADDPAVGAVVVSGEGGHLSAGLDLLRAVAPSARMAVLEPRWGLVPDLGATWRLPRLVGVGRATELILSGREVGAEEALAMGLAEIALPAEGAVEAAHALAARLAAGPTALRLVPRLVREAAAAPRESALAAEARAQLRALASGDLAVAVAAAADGRP